MLAIIREDARADGRALTARRACKSHLHQHLGYLFRGFELHGGLIDFDDWVRSSELRIKA